MNEPNLALTWSSEYVVWARENKKRADRLLAIVQEILTEKHDIAMIALLGTRILTELEMAALDYESTRG